MVAKPESVPQYDKKIRWKEWKTDYQITVDR